VERVSGEQRFLPVLQHVALSNKHINHPGMGPYILADAQPVDSGGIEGTKKAFFAAVDRGLYTRRITRSSGSGTTSPMPRRWTCC